MQYEPCNNPCNILQVGENHSSRRSIITTSIWMKQTTFPCRLTIAWFVHLALVRIGPYSQRVLSQQAYGGPVASREFWNNIAWSIHLLPHAIELVVGQDSWWNVDEGTEWPSIEAGASSRPRLRSRGFHSSASYFSYSDLPCNPRGPWLSWDSAPPRLHRQTTRGVWFRSAAQRLQKTAFSYHFFESSSSFWVNSEALNHIILLTLSFAQCSLQITNGSVDWCPLTLH